MKDEILENIITKYLENKASIKEINQLGKWYASFDSSADLYVPDSLELNQVMAQKVADLKVILGIASSQLMD